MSPQAGPRPVVREVYCYPSLERNDGSNMLSVIDACGEVFVASYIETPDEDMTSVLSMTSEPFSAKDLGVTDVDHFAAYPVALVEPFVKAGVPQHCCATCGLGYQREIEQETKFVGGSGAAGRSAEEVNASGKHLNAAYGANLKKGPVTLTRTTGFAPACDCPVLPSVPGIVLDPFGGSGTTAIAALKQDRRAILAEISPKYVKIQIARIQPEIGMFTEGGITVEKV